jgi:hypothetical protein
MRILASNLRALSAVPCRAEGAGLRVLVISFVKCLGCASFLRLPCALRLLDGGRVRARTHMHARVHTHTHRFSKTSSLLFSSTRYVCRCMCAVRCTRARLHCQAKAPLALRTQRRIFFPWNMKHRPPDLGSYFMVTL